MNETAKEARRAYRRKWAAENPEKVAAWQERYWMKKARQAEQEKGQGESPGKEKGAGDE